MKSKGFLKGIAIVAIVIGSLVMLFQIIGLIIPNLLFSMNFYKDLSEDIFKVMQDAMKYNIPFNIAGLIVNIGYLISGIMLLKVNITGKKILIFSSIIGILVIIGATILHFIVVEPALEKIYRKMFMMKGIGRLVSAIGAIIGLMCSLVFPLFFLIGIHSSSVKKQFAETQEGTIN
ncbi:MAG: hypothetical protein OEV44_09560 [Spirochaetota bacterium]|nr:hypothetical protein [Spirochaetota bacterium]